MKSLKRKVIRKVEINIFLFVNFECIFFWNFKGMENFVFEVMFSFLLIFLMIFMVIEIFELYK